MLTYKEKKTKIIKSVSNLISIDNNFVEIKCPICERNDYIDIDKVLKRLKNKGNNHKEDKFKLTCSNRKCSNSQAQKRKSTREKIKQTNLERYGYDTFLETPESNELMIKKTIEKYGSLKERTKKGWENYYKKQDINII